MKAIIQIVGPPGTGKTTIAEILIHELADSERAKSGKTLLLLAVDASGDVSGDASANLRPAGGGQTLTSHFSPQANSLTLAGVIENMQAKAAPEYARPESLESIDWQCHDLTVPVGEEIDLLTLGPLHLLAGFSGARPRSPVEKALAYGLNRLLREYDYVVIDGDQPGLTPLLSYDFPDHLHLLLIMTPAALEAAANGNGDLQLNTYLLSTQPISLITNRCDVDHPVSPAGQAWLDQALSSGSRLRPVGKLPQYATFEAGIRQMPNVFQNCLLKMDLPLPTSF